MKDETRKLVKEVAREEELFSGRFKGKSRKAFERFLSRHALLYLTVGTEIADASPQGAGAQPRG